MQQSSTDSNPQLLAIFSSVISGKATNGINWIGAHILKLRPVVDIIPSKPSILIKRLAQNRHHRRITPGVIIITPRNLPSPRMRAISVAIVATKAVRSRICERGVLCGDGTAVVCEAAVEVRLRVAGGDEKLV